MLNSKKTKQIIIGFLSVLLISSFLPTNNTKAAELPLKDLQVLTSPNPGQNNLTKFSISFQKNEAFTDPNKQVALSFEYSVYDGNGVLKESSEKTWLKFNMFFKDIPSGIIKDSWERTDLEGFNNLRNYVECKWIIKYSTGETLTQGNFYFSAPTAVSGYYYIYEYKDTSIPDITSYKVSKMFLTTSECEADWKKTESSIPGSKLYQACKYCGEEPPTPSSIATPTTNSTEEQIKNYYPLATLPNLGEQCKEVCDSYGKNCKTTCIKLTPDCQINEATGKVECTPAKGFGDYLNIIINLFIGICAVLAMIMIVMGGIQYMTSELISSKQAAKDTITRAILGLLIALGAFAILNTINPNLLDISLQNIETANVVETGGFSTDTLDSVPGGFNPPEDIYCPKSGGISEIPAIVSSMEGKIAYRMGGKGQAPPYNSKYEQTTVCDGSHACKDYCPPGNVCLDCSGFADYVWKCAGVNSINGQSSGVIFNDINNKNLEKLDPAKGGLTKDASGNVFFNKQQLQRGDVLGWPSGDKIEVGHVYLFLGSSSIWPGYNGVEVTSGSFGRNQGKALQYMDVTTSYQRFFDSVVRMTTGAGTEQLIRSARLSSNKKKINIEMNNVYTADRIFVYPTYPAGTQPVDVFNWNTNITYTGTTGNITEWTTTPDLTSQQIQSLTKNPVKIYIWKGHGDSSVSLGNVILTGN